MPNATEERTTVAPRIPVNHVTQSFTEIAAIIRNEGLLRRGYTFYATYFAILVLALAGVIAGVVLIGDSWWQLLMAGLLGIVLTHFAFMSHEAAHRTIFASGKANDNFGRFLTSVVLGVSFQWWMNKHSRHHANPNTVGKDPDIRPDTIMFLEEDAAESKGYVRWIVGRQGWLFFPLLTLEGLNLHRLSVESLIRDAKPKDKWIELSGIFLHFVIYLVPLFLFLPTGMAFAFVGVQMAVFGVYMGASFAPNHKGMAIIEEGTKVDFLTRQVLTARNVSGGWPMSIFMGGLNYQVEHHLFPNMARPYLARTRVIVKAHCESLGLEYTETTLIESYRIVVRYLNEVGLSARDPFDCPERVSMGR